ncbi:DinB family protein [Sulfitobacter sp. D35]|uniref:DinB family protein n=1 Tax=Sulfitobacter sp. D35 TaxID=3083252 RepID=UPI00296F12AC|nr:DinB family protein [Sulfitobacter sp. D35]MDW4496400.1 DinB family protein [Sulfitobacter sp. D35]
MIAPGYVVTMARYNAWQNGQITQAFKTMHAADLYVDRGAFFGSLLGTANHLLWGDRMWMSRFDRSVTRPEGGIKESPGLCESVDAWAAARDEMDGRIKSWAKGLQDADIKGDLTFFSGALGREATVPMWRCVTHMFNHQTHHRGQIHAMLTAAGATAPVSDLFMMPQEV